MASTLKVDQIETPSGVGNISFAQPISGDGSQLTGVGLAVGGGAVTAGDFLYHDGTEWTRLPKGTAAQYLRMNAGATAPEWIATSGAGIQVPASSAAGDILYYDGTNYIRLAKGTASQTLAMNSGATAPEWTTPAGGGAWNLLQTHTASNSASLDDTTHITSAYKIYKIEISNLVPVTDNVNIYMRMGDATGFYSGATDYSWATFGSYSTSSNWSFASGIHDDADPYIRLATVRNSPFVGNSSMEGFHASLTLNGHDSTMIKSVRGSVFYRDRDGEENTAHVGGALLFGGTLSRVQIYAASGNLASGTMSLYGLSQ